MTRRKIIYVAGPISGGCDTKSKTANVLLYLKHLGEGIRAASLLLKMGFAPFCPHLDYPYSVIDEHTPEELYETSMAFLMVSDGMLVMPGWTNSAGTQAEIKMAESKHIETEYVRTEDAPTLIGAVKIAMLRLTRKLENHND